jgi:hypothetical protein
MTPEELIDQIVRDAPNNYYCAFCYSTDDPKIYSTALIDGELVQFWDMSDSFVKRYCGPFREIAVEALKDFCSGNFDCVARLNVCGEFETILDPN